MNNLFDISGKVAVVTGGSRGIGAMIARGFVENGARVYITARREEELQATAEALGQLGECIPLRADLSTAEGVRALAGFVGERESQLDILVNNAGATWGAPLEEFPESGWDKTMDLNVKALFFLTQALLPLLRSGASGGARSRVINIGSINGIGHSHMQNYAYSASKAAVHHLTRHLAADLAEQGINVNAIAPGLFPSKMTAYMLPEEEKLARGIPIHRLGSPEDAAGTAIYLSARASEYMTGHVVVLDGGMVAAA